MIDHMFGGVYNIFHRRMMEYIQKHGYSAYREQFPVPLDKYPDGALRRRCVCSYRGKAEVCPRCGSQTEVVYLALENPPWGNPDATIMGENAFAFRHR